MSSGHIGAATYASRLGGNGVAARYMRREAVSIGEDYQPFVDLLYEDISAILNTFQANPQRRHEFGEDAITDELVSNLSTAGYEAWHDVSAGGHVDVTVKLGKHTWIGEAKKDQKFDEGYLQLITRYRPLSGNFDHNHGGMLLYCTTKATLKVQVERWKEKFVLTFSNEYPNFKTWDCPSSKFAFFSSHDHPITGYPYIVRHMLVGLHFEPQDASGRRSRSPKTAKAPRKKSTVAKP